LERQRIDRWLWHARLVRTRADAAALAQAGALRVNGARIRSAGRKIAAGDVLTVAFERVRILKVLGFSERRGSAADARSLYEDLGPAAAKQSGTDATGTAGRAGARKDG
jgi:ribosome-associated heat shock protein Hsp15